MCGVILQHYNPGAATEAITNRSWLRNVRAGKHHRRSSWGLLLTRVLSVYSKYSDDDDEDTANHYHLSGVGNMVVRDILFAPRNRDKTHKDAVPGDMDLLPLFDRNNGPEENYGMHDECWLILKERLEPIEDLDKVVEALVDLFDDTEVMRRSYLDFGNRITGMPTNFKPKDVCFANPSLHPVIGESTDWSMDLHYPELFIMRHSYSNLDNAVIQALRLPDTPALSTENTPTRSSILPSLPLEVVYMISSHLTVNELAALRLVCRPLALLARPENVPAIFWRRQFEEGGELDFLCVDTSKNRNWAGLAYSVKMALVHGDLTLLNHRRIRRLIEPLAKQIERMISKDDWEIEGEDVEQTEDNLSFKCETDPESSKTWTILRKHDRRGNPSIIEWNAIEYCATSFPKECCMRIYSVGIGCHRYICGLEGRDHAALNNGPWQLGYCKSTSFAWIHCQSSISAIHTAFSKSGLVGIRFWLDMAPPSPWIGQSEGLGIVRKTIPIPRGSSTYDLFAGMDTHKIVSIGIASAEPLYMLEDYQKEFRLKNHF